MNDTISLIKSIDRKIRKSMDLDQKFFVDNKVTKVQSFIIGFLYKNEGEIYQKDIEEHFKISKASASELLNSMEENELIIRETSPKDGRLKSIKLTERGKSVHIYVMERLSLIEEEMLKGLSKEEKEILISLLTKLNDRLEGYINACN